MENNTRLDIKLFGIFFLFTLFSFLLLGYRIHETNNILFIFLIKNLFLAWIPYWLVLLLQPIWNKTKSWFLILPLLFTWLMFLPNSPYIITDFLHLRPYRIVPMWYDIMMLFSFALTGLLLGFASMLKVHQFLKEQWGQLITWFTMINVILLCGFGVYIGRFQRWNSWDIATRPMDVLQDMLYQITHPNMNTFGLAVVITGFIFVGYIGLITLISKEYKQA